jgi:hypothetical protein
VLISASKAPAQQVNPQFRRYADTDLADMEKAPAPAVMLT